MTALALRSIGSNDYAVIDDGYPIGRIRLAAERGGETWNCTIPVPGAPNGTAGSLDAAKAAFRESWTKFKAAIGPERLAGALEIAEAARGRNRLS
jgi:hypothetical protein